MVFEETFLFSDTRRAPTSPTAGPTPPTPRSRPRPARPRRTSSSRACPTATTPSSASAASPCRAASASASRWPGRCSPTRGSSSSTTPPRRSTRRPRRRSTPPCASVMERPHHDPRRPPPVDAAPRRPHRRGRRAAGSSTRAPTRSSSPARPLYRDLLGRPRRRRRSARARPRSRDAGGDRDGRRDRRGRGPTRAVTGDRRPRPVGQRRPAPPRIGRPGGGGAGGGERWRMALRRHPRAAGRGRPAARRPTTSPTSTSTPRWPPTTGPSRLRALPPARSAAALGLGLGAGRARHPAHPGRAAARPPRPRPRRGPRIDERALWVGLRGCSSPRSLVDWVVTWGYTRVHGPDRRAAAVRAAGPDLRPPAAAVGRLLRPGDGGPDHDPHDDRRRGASPAAADRPDHRHRQRLHLRRRAGRRSASSTGAWRCAAAVVLPPLVLATCGSGGRRPRTYDVARDRIAAVNANFQESLSGVRVAQAYRREDRNIADVPDGRRRLPRRPAPGPAADRRSTSRSSCCSPTSAAAVVLGVGRRRCRATAPGHRRAS